MESQKYITALHCMSYINTFCFLYELFRCCLLSNGGRVPLLTIYFIQLTSPTEMTEVFAQWLAQVGSAILILVEISMH